MSALGVAIRAALDATVGAVSGAQATARSASIEAFAGAIEAISGEVNTASNAGATGARLFKGKTLVDLAFRRLIGAGLRATENADDVTLVVTPDAGYANHWDAKAPGGTTFITSPGMPAMTSGGTVSTADDADAALANFATDGASGTTVGRRVTSFSQVRARDWAVQAGGTIKTDSTITSIGVWLGLFSANPASDTDPIAHLAAFRYFTSVDGTAFWRICTKDGTTLTVTPTTVPVAANTCYRWSVECYASRVDFYLDDVLVGSQTATLPATAALVGPASQLTALAAAIRNLKVGRLWLRYRQ